MNNNAQKITLLWIYYRILDDISECIAAGQLQDLETLLETAKTRNVDSIFLEYPRELWKKHQKTLGFDESNSYSTLNTKLNHALKCRDRDKLIMILSKMDDESTLLPVNNISSTYIYIQTYYTYY